MYLPGSPLKAVVHRLEGTALATIGVGFKGDVWSRPEFGDGFHVLSREIPLVS